MKVNFNNPLNDNYIINMNEHHNFNDDHSKEKFKLLNIQEKKKLSTIKAKLSMKSSKEKHLAIKTLLSPKSSKEKSITSANKSNLSLNNSINESNKQLKELNKSNYNNVDSPKDKSSLNFKNYLDTKNFQADAKIAKTQTNYHSNNNHIIRRKSKFEKTKNNFLRLITKTNNGNYIREYTNKNSKYSLVYDNNYFKVYEDDSLEKVQKQLQNKIIDMEKEAELMEFEIGPLDISINRFKVKDNKKKILNKKTKNSEGKIINQIISQNPKRTNSEENIEKNTTNQYFTDNIRRINKHENNDIKNNKNLNVNFELNTINNKRRKNKKEKESNNPTNSDKKMIHFYENLKKIFRTSEHGYNFQKKDINLTKNKTYSNIDTKFGTTLTDKR